MDGIAEMLGLEKFADPVISRVVDQSGAEQGLFGFDIVWRGPQQLGVGLTQERDPGRHICFHAPADYHRPKDNPARNSVPSLWKAGMGLRPLAKDPMAANLWLATK